MTEVRCEYNVQYPELDLVTCASLLVLPILNYVHLQDRRVENHTLTSCIGTDNADLDFLVGKVYKRESLFKFKNQYTNVRRFVKVGLVRVIQARN